MKLFLGKVFFLPLFLLPVGASALWRRAWVGSLTGDPFWEEGDPLPTANQEVNRFLLYTEATYNIVLNAVGHRPAWNGEGNEIMFGVVQSEYADLRGERGPCTYGDAYFTVDNFGTYGTVFCEGMATANWVGHEWGHGYAAQAGLTTLNLETATISEFLADVLGFTVQSLANPQLPDTPRTACSKYGVNPGFAYIEGRGGPDDSKRWVIGVNCTSVICPTRDMWDPTCFGAADRVGSEYFLCGDGADEVNGPVKRSHMNNGVLNKFFALTVDGGVFNGYEILPLGLNKSVRIVFEALLPSDGTKRPPDMTFVDLAAYLQSACEGVTGTELRDLGTGEILDEIITAEDCNQVVSAITAVEMKDEPNCLNDVPSSSSSLILLHTSVVLVALLSSAVF